jgi:hypothetical protein
MSRLEEIQLSKNGGKPCTPFYLKCKKVLRSMKFLKFPNSYTAGLRWAVNVKTRKLNGLKSYDYHIIMERLMSLMFHGYLEDGVWKALVELSYFYR